MSPLSCCELLCRRSVGAFFTELNSPKIHFWKEKDSLCLSFPDPPSRSLLRTSSAAEFTAPSWSSTRLLTVTLWPQRSGSPTASTWSADTSLRRWKRWLSQTGEKRPLTRKCHSGSAHVGLARSGYGCSPTWLCHWTVMIVAALLIRLGLH